MPFALVSVGSTPTNINRMTAPGIEANARRQEPGLTSHAKLPIGAGFWLLPTSLPSALIWVIRADGMEHWP